MNTSPDELQQLIRVAQEARARAVAPYSNFQVGAALETIDNQIYSGCNIENASYGLTMCAERVAIFKAVSEGKREFKRLVIVADTQKNVTPPCGACRQIIWEFCGDIELILANGRGLVKSLRMKELLPHAFDAEFLADEAFRK